MNTKNHNNDITILLYNIGIDKWVNDFNPDISITEITNNNNKIDIVEYINNAHIDKFYNINKISFYDSKMDNINNDNIKYGDITKGIEKQQLDYTDKYKSIRYYSSYVENKQFDKFLTDTYKKFYMYVTNNSIDICIFQEFCDRLLFEFNFEYKATQLYETQLYSYEQCRKYIEQSRKCFFMGSNKYEIQNINNLVNIIPLGYMSKIPFQIGYITHNNNNIIIVNVHNRIMYDIYNVLSNLMNILKNENNVIIMGDFNIVNFDNTQREEMRKYKYDICDIYGITCNLKLLYDKVNTECTNTNKKFKLVNVIHKLSNYDVNFKDINCNYNTNVSSHIPIIITLKYVNKKNILEYKGNKYKEYILYNNDYNKINSNFFRHFMKNTKYSLNNNLNVYVIPENKMYLIPGDNFIDKETHEIFIRPQFNFNKNSTIFNVIQHITQINNSFRNLKMDPTVNGMDKYNGKLPDGFCIINAEKYNNVFDLFEQYYKNVDKKYINQRKNKSYIVDTDSIIEALSIIDKTDTSNNKQFYKFISRYIKQIYNITNINKYNQGYEILSGSAFTIIRYEKNRGLFPHIDQYFKNNGPLFISSYGPSHYYYDMIPVNNNLNKYPLRIEIPECDIVIMEGSSRYEWLHSVPFNSVNQVRYCIVIICHKYTPLYPYYSTLYNHKFMVSNIPCNNKKIYNKKIY
jgi:hypothetical protein